MTRFLMVESDNAAVLADVVRTALLGGGVGSAAVVLPPSAPAPGHTPLLVAELPVEQELLPEPAAAPRRLAGSKAAVAKAVREPAPSVAIASDSSLSDRILAAVSKRPMSAMELAAALDVPIAHVYSSCSLLKTKKGLLTNFKDETDTPRWKPTGR